VAAATSLPARQQTGLLRFQCADILIAQLLTIDLSERDGTIVAPAIAAS
jgi:hypothetical protein